MKPSDLRAQRIQTVLRYIEEHPGCRRVSLINTLGGLSAIQVSSLLNDLCERGIVRCEGLARASGWHVIPMAERTQPPTARATYRPVPGRFSSVWDMADRMMEA